MPSGVTACIHPSERVCSKGAWSFTHHCLLWDDISAACRGGSGRMRVPPSPCGRNFGLLRPGRAPGASSHRENESCHGASRLKHTCTPSVAIWLLVPLGCCVSKISPGLCVQVRVSIGFVRAIFSSKFAEVLFERLAQIRHSPVCATCANSPESLHTPPS
jgi:hypothetical protein